MKDLLAHGNGKMIYKTGDIFEGEFVEGKRTGTGQLTFEGITSFITSDYQ
jgi:hypothetical protein